MTDGLGLGDAYGSTLDRIKRQGGEKAKLGMAAIMWISHSERPLKANELCHALAVEIGSPNLNTENVPSIGTVLACCQGLIVVEKETSRVRLIHFTLQEYLRAHPDIFNAAHSAMAETCLSYLNSQQVKAISTNTQHPPHFKHSPEYWAVAIPTTPFLEYSSLYWGVHAKRDLSDCAKQLALTLFDDYNSHISTEILLEANYVYYFTEEKFSGFSGLHCASFLGIIEIVASLLEIEGCDVNQMDSTGSTPLHWAAWNGQEGVVRMLLERDDVNPDKPDYDGSTPLWSAAYNGHEGVVKILLERDDVNPNKVDKYGQSPLLSPAYDGHEGVAKILLAREDINPDIPTNSSHTPLLWAAYNGHEEVVKLLLARDDVDPNKVNKNGKTPLDLATENGHQGVITLLQPPRSATPSRSLPG